MHEKRNFTDDDIEALVKKMRDEFFGNLGKGLWALVWQGIIIALIGLSLYGAGLTSLKSVGGS